MNKNPIISAVLVLICVGTLYRSETQIKSVQIAAITQNSLDSARYASVSHRIDTMIVYQQKDFKNLQLSLDSLAKVEGQKGKGWKVLGKVIGGFVKVAIPGL